MLLEKICYMVWSNDFKDAILFLKSPVTVRFVHTECSSIPPHPPASSREHSYKKKSGKTFLMVGYSEGILGGQSYMTLLQCVVDPEPVDP